MCEKAENPIHSNGGSSSSFEEREEFTICIDIDRKGMEQSVHHEFTIREKKVVRVVDESTFGTSLHCLVAVVEGYY